MDDVRLDLIHTFNGGTLLKLGGMEGSDKLVLHFKGLTKCFDLSTLLLNGRFLCVEA